MSKGSSGLYFLTKGYIVSVISNLPANPYNLLEEGWEESTHPTQRERTPSREFTEVDTGLRIRFDPAEPGADGFNGIDHYHVYNPNSTSRKDMYLDKNGNPVRRGAGSSHIFPRRRK